MIRKGRRVTMKIGEHRYTGRVEFVTQFLGHRYCEIEVENDPATQRVFVPTEQVTVSK